jgi:hypothetical protein
MSEILIKNLMTAISDLKALAKVNRRLVKEVEKVEEKLGLQSYASGIEMTVARLEGAIASSGVVLDIKEEV